MEQPGWKEWLLVIAAGVLTLSVIVTGTLAFYLTVKMNPPGGTAAGRPGGGGNEDAAAIVTLDTTDTVGQTSPTTPTLNAADGPRLAYTSRAAGSDDAEAHIQIIPVTTQGDGEPRSFSTPGQTVALYPSWSPDGTRIAYITLADLPTQRTAPPATFWVSTADGSRHIPVAQAISNTTFIRPTWSPDGTRLAFASERDSGSLLHIAHADGSGIERQIGLPWPILSVAWSPTQDELLIIGGDPRGQTAAYLISVDGSEVVELHANVLGADWMSDGQAVVVGDYATQEVLRIGVASVRQGEGEPVAVRIATLAMSPLEIAVSPDGTYIAVASAGHHRQRYATAMEVIHVTAADSGAVTTISEGQGWVDWPDWSPDGRLAFTLGELVISAGWPPADLWLYDPATDYLDAITTAPGFEGLADWSPR